ncbi:hypothetical protein LSH36_12g36024 [Paralvinella palmiformis]|uniref:Uncharacterized protein n=1 Tax=Paralvinella palmiformis TaxID=53620 RepID=A0AAD9KEU5_9ANNE|nr:hypothetical protein LSH36_12g36024 [Paralvinella palmiformis]
MLRGPRCGVLFLKIELSISVFLKPTESLTLYDLRSTHFRSAGRLVTWLAGKACGRPPGDATPLLKFAKWKFSLVTSGSVVDGQAKPYGSRPMSPFVAYVRRKRETMSSGRRSGSRSGDGRVSG